jgi:two-component system cell cycle response regulator DivK
LLTEGGGGPTPFDTWITESLAREDAHHFDFAAGGQQPGERATAVKVEVLVAEDDRDTREVLTFYLGSLGYEAITVTSSGAAFDLARQRRPDLLIADANLPGGEGLELIRRFRADYLLNGLPILAVTAYGAEKTERAVEAGADACVAKPLNFTSLAQTIEGLLR